MDKRNKAWLAGLAAGIGVAFAGTELLARSREADLTGKVALITGGSSGLGFLLAREFARAGCRVATCARDAEDLDQAQRRLRDAGVEVRSFPCDVSEPEAVRKLVESVEEALGPIDLLVNNAGIMEVGPAEAWQVDDYQRAMDVIFWGSLYPALEVLPGMIRRRGGRIVNISSIGGKVSVPHMLPYCAAKFALVGLSEGLRTELSQHGISVLTVAPGMMRTGSQVNAQFKGQTESEYSWFAAGASLPGISMDAEQAAARIVKATRRGQAEAILGLPANLLALSHGVAPGMTADILALVNRWLPAPTPGPREPVPGSEIERRHPSPVRDAITTLGQEATRRLQPADAAASVSKCD